MSSPVLPFDAPGLAAHLFLRSLIVLSVSSETEPPDNTSIGLRKCPCRNLGFQRLQYVLVPIERLIQEGSARPWNIVFLLGIYRPIYSVTPLVPLRFLLEKCRLHALLHQKLRLLPRVYARASFLQTALLHLA